ncbi:sugar ABC transporter permease [Dactylosporangium aurantiacum]|uniref:Sugar ABC transporter permease n=1 Tax=Dactylosporangium aurantiacum TaxID=35754 RepID=A0A9Q9IKF1_9ACTN|nr:sugar ABC transporter permease [Dactylosporangium aurantiacum]MDG6109372.1 sugar ABC transporter permease [Dactylosporangium aurantiacum]UWZ56478.1 sugar ABC transporter permease [Dactylosporangium aurantiacum]
MRHGRLPFILGFLVAPVTLYSIFVLSPYFQTVQLSFYQWRGFTKKRWVGLENYDRMFHADRFWQALEHHAIMLVTLPLATIAFALFFAFLLNVGGKGRGGKTSGVWGSSFYRVVFFLPQVLAVPVVAVLFATVYRPNESGLINGFVLKAGLEEPIGFLIERNLALASLIAVLVWQAVGFYVVLFSAGMANIPGEIYEAAELDGASKVSLFFRITLPLLWETIQTAWVYLGILAFDGFAIVSVLAQDNGGPDGATTVLGLEIYNNMQQSRYGDAATYGVALCVLSLVFAAFTLRVTRRESYEF